MIIFSLGFFFKVNERLTSIVVKEEEDSERKNEEGEKGQSQVQFPAIRSFLLA